MLGAARISKGKFSMFQVMKRDTESDLAFHLSCQDLKPVSLASLHFEWIEPNVRRDKDNIVAARKFILDAMVQYGVLKSDGWKGVEGFSDSFRVDADRPGVKVTITELKPGLEL